MRLYIVFKDMFSYSAVLLFEKRRIQNIKMYFSSVKLNFNKVYLK